MIRPLPHQGSRMTGLPCGSDLLNRSGSAGRSFWPRRAACLGSRQVIIAIVGPGLIPLEGGGVTGRYPGSSRRLPVEAIPSARSKASGTQLGTSVVPSVVDNFSRHTPNSTPR